MHQPGAAKRREGRVPLHYVEDLRQRDAAPRRRWHRVDRVATIGDPDRVAPLGLVAGEVVPRDQTAAPRHLLHDQLGDAALIENLGSAVGDQLERAGQLRLNECRARLWRFPIREKLSARGGEPGEPLGLPADLATAHAVQRISLVGETHGGRDQVLPRQVPELAVRFEQPRDRPRHTDREVARQGRLPHVPRRINVHGARGTGRRGLPKVEGAHHAVMRSDDHEPAPADVASDGVHHREREADRHGGVDRIAAAPQNVHADVAREWMRSDHHGVLAGDGFDAQAKRPGGRGARVPSSRRRRTRGRALGGRRVDRRKWDKADRRDGDRLGRLDAAAARRQQQQAETHGSAHAELCTLTRVRVNV